MAELCITYPDDNHVRRLVGYAAAARCLGLALGTLRSMVSRRQLPHVRLSARAVRFELADLDALIGAPRIEADRRGGNS